MNAKIQELKDLIAQGETLKLEFKSDPKQLPDRDLVATVVSMANTEGGDILLGVEDDGSITGLHTNHSHTIGIEALIANKTSPSVAVRTETYTVGDKKVLRIQVPKIRQIVSTKEGLLQRRRLMANAKPEAVPFYPHEFIQRQSSLGLIDHSAMAVAELTLNELNPLERHRIRDAIKSYGGDTSLLKLNDDELDGALGMTVTVEGVRHPLLAYL